MASENGDNGDSGDGRRGEGHGPRECMPCRGTGRVISNADGEQRDVPCPWCEGKGVRIAGIDAQDRWRERSAAEG